MLEKNVHPIKLCGILSKSMTSQIRLTLCREGEKKYNPESLLEGIQNTPD